MRNKAKGFPYGHDNKFEGEPRAKAEFASRRADGTINTHPQKHGEIRQQMTKSIGGAC